MHGKIALVFLVVILVGVNWSIAGKETHLKEGKIVYLKLAPVDPRSLIQGDYMALRFEVADEIYKTLPKAEESELWRNNVEAGDGYAVIQLDGKRIGAFKRVHTDETLSKDEILMRYRVRGGRIKFATNAFFFQEGTAKDYEAAQYGQFRVDDSGELLLAAMHDKDLKKMGEK